MSFGITVSHMLLFLSNCQQYETLVTIVTMLKECSRKVTFDLAARAEYRDPERMERTVYVSPLAANITPDMVKVSLKTDVKIPPLETHLSAMSLTEIIYSSSLPAYGLNAAL